MAVHSAEASRSSSFVILSLSTAALTLGLIVFGAVVLVTESGLGCGTDWPLCNDTIFPPLDNITAWIEWLHRLFALLIGFFGLATLAAWRSYRQDNQRVLQLTVASAILFVVQSALGAIAVFLELPPTFVTLHLGVAILLLAALLGAAVLAWRPHHRRGTEIQYRCRRRPMQPWLSSFFDRRPGRGSGATLACTAWTLCDGGAILPVAQGQLAIINMIHRFSVAAMSVALFILIWQVHRYRTEPLTRRIPIGAVATHIVQIVAGAMFVLSSAGREWGAIHVCLALPSEDC